MESVPFGAHDKRADMTKAAEIWKRMQENAAENAKKLGELGLASHQMRAISCGACKTVESLLFWTFTGQSGHMLQFQCAACETFGVQYDVDTNAISIANPRLARFGGLSELLATAALLTALFVGVGHALSSGGFTSGFHGLSSVVAGTVWRSAGEVMTWGSNGKTGQIAETIYLAPGDRQAEITRYLEAVDQDAELVQSVLYLPEFDQTRLVLARDSQLWQSQLAECGWARVSGPDGAAKEPVGRAQGECGSGSAAVEIAMRTSR